MAFDTRDLSYISIVHKLEKKGYDIRHKEELTQESMETLEKRHPLIHAWLANMGFNDRKTFSSENAAYILGIPFGNVVLCENPITGDCSLYLERKVKCPGGKDAFYHLDIANGMDKLDMIKLAGLL